VRLRKKRAQQNIAGCLYNDERNGGHNANGFGVSRFRNMSRHTHVLPAEQTLLARHRYGIRVQTRAIFESGFGVDSAVQAESKRSPRRGSRNSRPASNDHIRRVKRYLLAPFARTVRGERFPSENIFAR